MDEVRILEIKQSVFANNDQRAEFLRRELKEKRIFLLRTGILHRLSQLVKVS